MRANLDFQAEVRLLLRNRILDAARELVCAQGWAAVSMSQIASRVGTSRQQLYKEIGAKPALGAALVTRETDHFLTGTAECLRRFPADPAAGLTAAAEFTLREGAHNSLIKAIVSGVAGPDLGLLPLLTVDSDLVLHRAIAALTAAAQALHAPVGHPESALDTAVEVAVRLTLSHLLQPIGPVEEAVEQIRLTVTRLLASADAS